MTTQTLTVPGWTPRHVNFIHQRLLERPIHTTARDRQVVLAAAQDQGLRLASSPRAITVVVTSMVQGRMPAPWSLSLVLLDALVCAGLLVHLTSRWVEVRDITVERGELVQTVVELEDLGPEVDN